LIPQGGVDAVEIEREHVPRLVLEKRHPAASPPSGLVAEPLEVLAPDSPDLAEREQPVRVRYRHDCGFRGIVSAQNAAS
jgi:hypothetical protein